MNKMKDEDEWRSMALAKLAGGYIEVLGMILSTYVGWEVVPKSSCTGAGMSTHEKGMVNLYLKEDCMLCEREIVTRS